MKHQSLSFDVAHMIGVYNKVAEFHWMCLNDKKTMKISVTKLMGNWYTVGYSDARSFAKASLELATGKTVLSQTIFINCAKRVLLKVLQNLILEQSTYQRQTLLHPFHVSFYCHYRVHWRTTLKSKAPSRPIIWLQLSKYCSQFFIPSSLFSCICKL